MAEIHDKTKEVLEKELSEKREALRSFRFGSSGSHSRNVKEGRSLRKEIARLLTEVSRRSNA